MRLCLNMIVKNEASRIERALRSATQFITCAVVVDTGSTDNTKDVIKSFFLHHHIPCAIEDTPFEDWSQARNAALFEARCYRTLDRFNHDYVLLMDADMELVVRDVDAFMGQRLDAPAWDMWQRAGSLHYQNRRLVNAKVKGEYRGVTHEYLDIASAGCISPEVAYFVDHADGANRPEKFKRDIRLLKKGLKDEPNNERYMFYLAQSYRDAGQPGKAAEWYRKRISAGGWDEEVWCAQHNLAHCYKDLKDEGKYVSELFKAYNMRPTRAETMFDMAHYYRHGNNPCAALAAAESVEHLPKSTDALFVNDYVYDVGIKEEIGITAFYVPGKREKGYKVTSDLSLAPGPYGGARELARTNLYYYLQPLEHFCPSFKWQNIDFKPPDNWAAMNPSVTNYQGKLLVNVRCVNYRIDDQGRYVIKATDGSANDTNPINTRNFLLQLNPIGLSPIWVGPKEVLAPLTMPCEFKPVVGFEDMRIFGVGGDLYGSSTVRQIHWDGQCEQVLTKLTWDPVHENYYHADMHRMLRQPRECEKNWSPIGGSFKFMWRPGEVVDRSGTTISKHDTGKATGHISGSSQVIPWGSKWLAIVHEARALNGEYAKRYYYHRFALYNQDFRLERLSLPFYFNDKVIEFCAGMCGHPNHNTLVISYGYRDAEARIATVSVDEVEKFLWT